MLNKKIDPVSILLINGLNVKNNDKLIIINDSINEKFKDSKTFNRILKIKYRIIRGNMIKLRIQIISIINVKFSPYFSFF